MFRHDIENTGCSPSSAPDTIYTLWRYTTNRAVLSSPAVADGKVFIGSSDMTVYCLDEENGTVIWTYQTGGAVFSGTTIANGKIIVGSNDKTVYCFASVTSDDIPPTIKEVSLKPSNPKEDEPANINADIKDKESGVADATLYYWIDNSTVEIVSMNRTNYGWRATVPPQENGREVYYYIEAADIAGNIGKSNTYSYIVTADGDSEMIGLPIEILIIAGFATLVIIVVFRKRLFEIIKKRNLLKR